MDYEEACKYVFKEEGIDWSCHVSKRRDADLNAARQISMFLGNRFFIEVTWLALGKMFGRDHSTAIHAVKVINNEIDTNKQLKEKIRKYSTYIASKIEATNEANTTEKLTQSYALINNAMADTVSRMRTIALAYCQLTNNKIVPNEDQN